MKRNVLVLTLLAFAVLSGCSKFDQGTDLKNSVNDGISKINNAASALSVSGGFQLLSVTGDPGKGENSYNDSIKLEMIAGKYEFSPYKLRYMWCPCPTRFFRKTGESDSLIVNMPWKMAYRPVYMYNYVFKDTVNRNNFRIAASDYHFYHSWFNKYDYKLSAAFMLDGEDLGSLELLSSAMGYKDQSYNSTYTFAEGYAVEVAMDRGDTTKASFALMEDEEVLLKETRIYSGSWCNNDYERKYILTIGDVDIVRSNQFDSIQVWLNGVLQKNAAARIIDDSDTTGTICHKRDILLTFDDGTTANLSAMIRPGMQVLRTLVDSLHNMNFAKRVVDYIALNIYYHEFKYPHDDD